MSGLIQVSVVLDLSVRDMCFLPYDLHPKGCPNYGKRPTCPPGAALYREVYDLTQPVYAVVNEFNLGEHVERMRSLHPDWSERQLRCVLYWQAGARKQLKKQIGEALRDMPYYIAETCPEAMGVNVTQTLHQVGIELEWPPVHIARQVALLGRKRM
jgi:predicted metal-binding protein